MWMSLNKEQLKDLKSLGYHLIKNSNPPKFSGGGQFVGDFILTEKEALENLISAKQHNMMWLEKFGQKLYSKI